LQSQGVLADASGGGQSFLAQIAAGGTDVLALPATEANAAGEAGCAGALAANPGLCAFLLPGFWSGTENSYGQTYGIRVLKDGTAAGTPPQSYSFMIVTQNGDTIPDTSGGRISTMIGGDGGFIFSNDVCGTATTYACGSYGAWKATPLTTYGFSAISTGHVASRTYYSPSLSLNNYWLARNFVPGDNAASGGGTSPVFNTMTTPLFLGRDTSGTANTGRFYLGGTSDTAGTDGGTVYAKAELSILAPTARLLDRRSMVTLL